ncbi:holliday junction resolvase [Agrobacterium phage OLIVR1]|uniref:Holliday junction resolvase n=1 Tax=Agrobacterium phage OLIVR1 TaxID=2723769 RepID=A0A858MXK4_9CAUD|nr:holliday junction resolvase [Agrobacterium phage OLIVR1]QIW87275.1 holliday junction resolvase [Agrobacterium phage OLIVR1]
MQIPVLGMDPSLTNWGLASVELNLTTGIPTTPFLQLIEPKDLAGKNIRVNSNDLWRAEQLAQVVLPACQKAKVIFAEVPVGSQSARAMASYGICVGIMSVIRAVGIQIIEVAAIDSKKALTGKATATKQWEYRSSKLQPSIAKKL